MSNLLRILIVDDEYLLRQGIKHLVDWNKEGFEIVAEASNGKEALELIENLKPHIIISDVVMPIMDGVDLAKIVKAKYPEIQILILSGYSDFNYVKDTFKVGVNDYVLKPKLNPEELVLLLKSAASKIPNINIRSFKSSKSLNIDNLLNKLISGFDTSFDEKDILEAFPHDSFCLIGDNIKKLASINSLSISSLRDTLSTSAKNFLQDLSFYEIDFSNDLFLILINFDNKKYSEVIAKVNKMLEEVSKDITKVFFVLSKNFYSLHDLKDIYINSFKPLLGYKFYFKDRNLISYELLPNNNLKEKFDFKYYSDQIYMFNIDTALNYLKDYLNLAIKNCSINEFELKTLFENALYSIINILDELNFNVEAMNNSKSEYFQGIDETNSPDELLALFDKIVQDINEEINKDQGPMNDHILNKIIEYIYKHYNEQLSLKQLADKFHFNYYYLSTYFSSHNKEGFSEYLNKIRMEKAAELLRNEKIAISEVCYMVGYSDHSYFCKVFKKFNKLTPSKFRKNILSHKRG